MFFFSVAEVERLILDYIQEPTTSATFANKNFLKTVICDVLKLNIDDLHGKYSIA